MKFTILKYGLILTHLFYSFFLGDLNMRELTQFETEEVAGGWVPVVVLGLVGLSIAVGYLSAHYSSHD